jgi:hypothetical protein
MAKKNQKHRQQASPTRNSESVLSALMQKEGFLDSRGNLD